MVICYLVMNVDLFWGEILKVLRNDDIGLKGYKVIKRCLVYLSLLYS